MVRTRFAPSPTGHLHLGGARTALFSYYFAKHVGGSFVLRIEDTDTQRSKEEFTVGILKSLRWLGLEWEEPLYKQSERQAHYTAAAKKLLDSGHAYQCFLTPAELDAARAAATARGEQFRVRSPWREKKPDATTEGQAYAVRFRYPESGQTIVHDGILGDVTFENSEGDDLIILRSDGTPTYQLSVVVDDIDMKITHVIRGDDHLNNTPKQLNMMKALGANPPHYAHCPMILGPDKAKLSKRHGALSVYQYAEEGYLPEALRNALIRLGWSHGDQELFTNSELEQFFTLEGCGKSPSVFDVTKLRWINGEFIKKQTLGEFVTFVEQVTGLHLAPHLERPGFAPLLAELQKSVQQATEVPAKLKWYLQPVEVEPDCQQKVLGVTDPAWIKAVVAKIETAPFEEIQAMEIFNSVAAEFKIKLPPVAKAVRVLLTGNLHSPDMNLVFHALGQAEVILRLRQFAG